MTGQMKILLGDDLRKRLDEVCSITDNSVAEEIRQRLERSFLRDALSPQTHEFVDFIVRLEKQIMSAAGWPWFAHAGLTEVFATAVEARAKRLTESGQKKIDFEIETEPFVGKKITTENERREYGRFLEWIDARMHSAENPTLNKEP